MAEKVRWEARGLVVSLNTPFDERDRIDWKALGNLLELHIVQGAIGFLVPAQAAEVHFLSSDERVELVRQVRDRTRNRAILIACATALNERESILLAEAAVNVGCDGVLSEPPYSLAGSRDLLRFFSDVASTGPELLMIQDLDWNGTGMTIETILQLFEEIDSFRALKVEVNPAGPKYTAVLEATGNRLQVSGGWAALQMVEALDRGVEVFMNTAFTLVCRSIMDAYFRGDRDLAKQRFHRLLPLLAFTQQGLDVSIFFHKKHFLHLGVFSTNHCRAPCPPWDKYYERQSDELMEYGDSLLTEAEGWN